MIESVYSFASTHAAGIGSMVALLSLFIPSWRKTVEKWFRSWQRWFSKSRIEFEERISKSILDTNGKLDALCTKYAGDSTRWDGGLDTIQSIVSILENGVSHKIAILAAQHRQAMEAETRPVFVCDEEGGNLMSSAGYLNLIGLTDHDDLSDAQWQMILHGPLKNSYLSDFQLAKDKRVTLKSVCDFQNPDTGEHRGRWRVIARCVQVNEALIFTGHFKPEDNKAREIAAEFGWT